RSAAVLSIREKNNSIFPSRPHPRQPNQNTRCRMRPAMWTRIVCSLVALAWFGLAEAQYYRHAKPLPPRGLKIDAAALAAQSSAASPWQPVKSPPPFPPNECNGFGAFPGGGNPLLLTDGTVIIQDAGCPDWVRLTPDS